MRSNPGSPAVRRPSIGVTPELSSPRAGHPVPLYELKASYADAVLKAGGLPMVIPYVEDPSSLEAYLERISGLVVTGGPFDPLPEVGAPSEGHRQARANFERRLLEGALERRLPVLGVCGGMQVLNALWGGTLFEDLRADLPHAKNHLQRHDATQPLHPIEVRDGTVLAEALGRGPLMVNSTHRKAVRAVGSGVVVSAVAPDGVIEGVESSRYPFAVGVQWHPELLIHSVPPNLGVYKALVGKARDLKR